MDADEVVDLLVSDPASAGLFSDFDGTLSPVVSDPDAAVPIEGVGRDLLLLADRLAKVAVVSGRPAGFLAGRLTPPDSSRLELYGLHGLEEWVGGAARPVAAAEPYAAAAAEAVVRARAAGIVGLLVEDKVFGLTLHWRAAPDPAATEAAAAPLAEQLAAESRMVLRPGKMSVELVPPLGIDKGSVVAALGAGLRSVCFMGDDLGDLRAFDSLDRLQAAGARVARVAVSSPEAPDELLERADLVLEGPERAAALLRALADSA